MSSGHTYEVLRSRAVFQGRVLTVRSDEVSMPDGGSSQRDVVELPGAVGIVAVDAEGRVLLVRQYRHPVRRPLWEIPAGLLDSTEETALDAARRELREEGALEASRWETLVDMLTSPGMSDETIRVLLARDLTALPEQERHHGLWEEAEMESRWMPLEHAADQVLSGELENSITAVGLLAAERALRLSTSLRTADSPWQARKVGP